ncbi:MAG: hypothetical protein KDD89_09080 [Anaerolineales bacterium]|nr:hypothetical protein [Anaerolineales bacterium]
MSQKTKRIQYLAVGHIARDVIAKGTKPGGTAVFSARLAQTLGRHTAVVTSTRPDYDLRQTLPHIPLHNVPATADTTFENQYDGNQRTQYLRSAASTIQPTDIPDAWRTAEIVHLGPIANEIDPAVIDLFDPSQQLIGLTPQGWMRRWDEHGRVSAQRFPAAEKLLRRATIVVISEEDLLDDAMLDQYRAWANILVMTQNYAGCRVFVHQQEGLHVPAMRQNPVDPTGAGDIFAAALFIRYALNGQDALEAAYYANFIASQSVTKADLAQKVVAWREIPG